jgi:hypothetical protein
MKTIIKNPLTGKELQIAENNFPKRMNWKDAMSSAKNLGRGWRLPTVFELELIRTELYLKNKGNLPISENGYYERYWSSELDEDGLNAWAVYMYKDHKEKLGLDNDKFVRAVKNK